MFDPKTFADEKVSLVFKCRRGELIPLAQDSFNFGNDLLPTK